MVLQVQAEFACALASDLILAVNPLVRMAASMDEANDWTNNQRQLAICYGATTTGVDTAEGKREIGPYARACACAHIHVLGCLSCSA